MTLLYLALLCVLGAALRVATADDADKALLEKAVGGDRASMQQVIARLLPVIQARVRVYLSRRAGRTLGAQDSDDLVQEIWLTLIKEQGRLLLAYDPGRGMSLEGYVGLLCRRELWRHSEAHQAEKRGGGLRLVELDEARDARSGDDPERTTVARGDLKRLRAHLLSELSPRGRLVLSALYDDGLSVDQAAELIGVKRQVIYNWQHKIRKLSREFLAPA